MTLNLGVKPARMTFTLTEDADFYAVLQTRDGTNFPVTAILSIVWVDSAGAVLATWLATVDADTATFHEVEADVADLIGDEPVQGRLFYEDGAGGPEILLAKGPINDESD